MANPERKKALHSCWTWSSYRLWVSLVNPKQLKTSFFNFLKLK
jgi:hypothetical protein